MTGVFLNQEWYNELTRVYTAVYTTRGTTIENELVGDFAVPPLPKEALVKLPKYCEPTKNNLATQYYYWNRDLIKQNKELLEENKRLKEEHQRLKEEKAKLEKKKEELQLERDKFLRMLFKPKREKQSAVPKAEPKPRTKQSYVRPTPCVIDEKREAILKQCPHCDSKLSKRVGYYQRVIEDIPDLKELRAKAIQYTINRYYCKYCQKVISAKPKEVLPRTRLGINTLLYVLYSKYRLRLPHNLIQENLETHFNLKVSEGGINNLLNKGHQVFKDKWQEIIEKVKQSKSVNADETSWRINGENNWLWAFNTDKAVRYTISEFRGKGVPKQVLGENYDGVVGCDFYTAYNQFKHKQRCWVHLLRKAKELKEQIPSQERIKLYHQLNRIYQGILFFRLKSARNRPERDKKAEQTRQKLLIIGRQETGDQELQKLYNRTRKYAAELVICIKLPYVPPDNNPAERALRGAVVARKISGGSRSRKGAFTHEVNLSVIETLRKEKHNLFEAMQGLVLKYITSDG